MKLKEILNICDNFIKKSEDFESISTFNNMLQDLKIKTYMPMQEKVINLVRVVIDSDKDIDVPSSMFTAGLEIACCFDGLLSYIIDLEPEVNLDIKNYENYDLIYQSGLADYILQYCEKDYERLVKMMERTLSYQNLTELIQSIKEMDVGSLDKLTNNLKQLKNEIDPEIIKNLADIMKLNDPALNDLKEKLEQTSIDEAFKKVDKGTKLKIVSSSNNEDLPE